MELNEMDLTVVRRDTSVDECKSGDSGSGESASVCFCWDETYCCQTGRKDSVFSSKTIVPCPESTSP